RFFIESDYPLVAYVELPKTSGRAHTGHRHGLAMSSMELNQGLHIYVADAITIGQHEALLTFKILPGAPDASTSHAVQAGFDQGDLPILVMISEASDLSVVF